MYDEYEKFQKALDLLSPTCLDLRYEIMVHFSDGFDELRGSREWGHELEGF